MAIDKVATDPGAQTAYSDPTSGMLALDYGSDVIPAAHVLSPQAYAAGTIDRGKYRIVHQTYTRANGFTGGTGTVFCDVEYSINGGVSWALVNSATSSVFVGQELIIDTGIQTSEIELGPAGTYPLNQLLVRTTVGKVDSTAPGNPGIQCWTFAKVYDNFAFLSKPIFSFA